MSRSVLVVDDDPLYLDLVRDILATQNLPVHSASDGASALRVLDSTRIHLIISDVEMPGMDGLTLLDRVRRDERHASIPFVFLTGATSPVLLEKIRKYRDVRLVHKSNLVSELLDLVGAL